MIHPSYVELMKVVNNNVEIGEEPVVNSRYSIVIAAAKRARQIIDGAEPLIARPKCNKPLSIAVEEREVMMIHGFHSLRHQESLIKSIHRLTDLVRLRVSRSFMLSIQRLP